MTEPTWGEFAELADSRLHQALAALTAEPFRTLGQRAARRVALAEVCGQLHSYGIEFSPLARAEGVHGITDGQEHRLLSNLQALQDGLRRSGTRRRAPDPVVEQLGDAARLLALGRDVLASHHGPDRRPRSPYAAYLDAPAVAQRIVADTVELAGVVGRAATLLALPDPATERITSPAQHLDLLAIEVRAQIIGPVTVLGRARVDGPGDALGGLALPAVQPPPVRPAEPPSFALAGAGAGWEWLAAHTVRQQDQRVPGFTVAELVAVANHTALGHLLAARLVEHTRGAVTSDPAPAAVLGRAGEALRSAAQSWQQVAASWGPHFGSAPAGGPGRLAVREAEFAVVRIGRTLFAADGWSPREGGRLPLRPAEAILADADQAAGLLATVRAVGAAGEVLAQYGPQIAHGLAKRGVLLSSDPAHHPLGGVSPADQMKKGWTRWYQAAAGQLDPVTAAYGAARLASAAAEAAAGHAAEAAGYPLARARLDADRRRVLAVTGDPVLDAQRARAAAARARSVTTPERDPDSAKEFRARTRELKKDVARGQREARERGVPLGLKRRRG